MTYQRTTTREIGDYPVRKLTKAALSVIVQLLKDGWSISAVARKYLVDRCTIYYWLKKMKIKYIPPKNNRGRNQYSPPAKIEVPEEIPKYSEPPINKGKMYKDYVAEDEARNK